jgi:hypothetical protein
MLRGSKAVEAVRNQVNGNRPVPCQSQLIAHPTISSANIQYQSTPRHVAVEHTAYQMVVAAGPDLPLFTVPSSNVAVRQIQVEIVAVARAALRRPDVLVVLREALEMLRSFRRQCMHNAVVDIHLECAGGTSHAVQPGGAAGALQKNAKLEQGINEISGYQCFHYSTLSRRNSM